MRSAIKAALATALSLSALVAAPGAAAAPARIAFAFGPKLMLMDADGSHRSTLLARRGFEASQPAWSPNGKTIVFAGAWNGADGDCLFTMRADGSHRRHLTDEPSEVDDTKPAWSPDGKRIAFIRTRYDDFVTELVTIDQRGGHARVVAKRVAKTEVDEIVDAAWAPDGRRLVFTRFTQSRRGNEVASLWSVAASGGRPHLLAQHAYHPAFSPDGRRIAYIGSGQLHVMSSQGRSKRRLTSRPGHDYSPSWSPDGRRIAFVSSRSFPSAEAVEIYSVRPDGSCLTWLTNGAPDSDDPAWQPGVARSSEPAACGLVARRPILDVSLAPAHRVRGAPVWWLGRITSEHLLLSEAVGDRAGAFFDYLDCAGYRTCPRGTYVSSQVTCRRDDPALYAATAARIHRVQGHAIAYVPRDRAAASEVYTGPAAVAIDVHRRGRLDALAARLRRLGARRPPHALPAPRFGRDVWRPLDRAHRALRRTGSVRRAAHRLHKRPRQIRRRVALRRKLLRLGARRVRC